MTSSVSPSPKSLSADESDPTDNKDDKNSNQNIKDAPIDVDTDANTAKPVDSGDSDKKVSNNDMSDADGNGEAGAQPPEATVTMTSPSPDVVVATLDVPDPSSQVDIDVTQAKKGASAIKVDSNAQSSDASTIKESSSVDHTLSSSPAPEVMPDSNTEPPQIPNDEDNNDHQEPFVDDDAPINTEDDAEEEKEEKEAKLESYKQFIAEQFSNKKIDYPEVRVTIEAGALPSKMYFVMNILSAIIASYGLVTNSAAVVIGAMLVAMMLGPITGIALAIIDYRMPLLRKSLFTVVVGVSLVVVVGFVVGWLHKEQPLTAEILSRTQPTSMDLMIALAGGTAGAYAMVSPHLSVAVVGVAVATALVPPLAASGILFANGETQLGLGALLLAITNITAIQFTNAMVLWFLGFRRLVDDDYKTSTYFTFLRRNAVTILLLAGLGTYLTINLNTNARQQTFESGVKESINSYFIDKGNVLTNTQFDEANGYQTIRAVIRGETTPSSYDVRQIEAVITQDIIDNYPNYLPIKLQLRYLPVQVIEANPLIADKLDETDAAILTH